MKISMYQASIPVFIHSMKCLIGILEKGLKHAEARNFDPAVLVNSRIAPDMFPLSRQVQIVTDQAKGCGARLAGLEPPKFEDNETTIPELIARINRTIEYLQTLKPAQIDGTEDKAITLTFPGRTFNFVGHAYLLNFVIPNVFFHMTMTYALLRHNGVDVGKQDFIGKIE